MLGGSLYCFAFYLAVWYRKALFFRERRFNTALYYVEACSFSSSSTSTMWKPMNAAYRTQPIEKTSYPRRTSPLPRQKKREVRVRVDRRSSQESTPGGFESGRRDDGVRWGVACDRRSQVRFAWAEQADGEMSGRGSQ